MPEAAPVTSAISPAKTGGLPSPAKLGLLEIPVLDGEDVRGRQGVIPAERRRAQNDVDRVRVDVERDGGILRRCARW